MIDTLTNSQNYTNNPIGIEKIRVIGDGNLAKYTIILTITQDIAKIYVKKCKSNRQNILLILPSNQLTMKGGLA